VPDVLVVFLTLSEDREFPGVIIIETVVAFGPRERVRSFFSLFKYGRVVIYLLFVFCTESTSWVF
jgi:hypothetical protein